MGRRMYNRSGSWAEQKLVLTLTPALPGTVPPVLPCLSRWDKTEGASVRANAELCRWVKEIRVRRETHGLMVAPGEKSGRSVHCKCRLSAAKFLLPVHPESSRRQTAFDSELTLNLGAIKGRNPEDPKIRVYLVTFGRKTIPFLLRGSRARSR